MDILYKISNKCLITEINNSTGQFDSNSTELIFAVYLVYNVMLDDIYRSSLSEEEVYLVTEQFTLLDAIPAMTGLGLKYDYWQTAEQWKKTAEKSGCRIGRTVGSFDYLHPEPMVFSVELI